MWILILSTLLSCQVISFTHCATFSPDIKQNELRFPYGVNFKYNGILHQNMARVWIVTKFPLPKFEDLDFSERILMPDCDFSITKDHVKGTWTNKHSYLTVWMHQICKAMRPHVKLLQEKEKFYRNEVKQLLDEDISHAIPALGSAGRTKRFTAALIPAIAGLVTLAVESVSGYLQSKRNKNIAAAVNALSIENGHIKNQLNRHAEDLLLYGEFHMNSTEELVETLQDMYSRQTLVEEVMANLTRNWPAVYLENPAGAALYSSHASIYLSTLTEKYLSLLRDLITSLDKLVVAIKTLSEGKIPVELISPQLLHQFTLDVMKELAKNHPHYTLAFPHISYYYDMELVTFGVDSHKSLVITFPMFIKPIQSEPLVLYEIETVDVPVDDLNTEINSFTRVQIRKPYLAANSHNYIQLQIQELHMCKVIQKDYFCEELFMSKHANLLTCESALFYKSSSGHISEVCEFEFFLNKTVIPSVLDGGDEIGLANLDPDKYVTCDRQIRHKLSGPSYMLTNRSLLCECTVKSGLSFIPQDIGSCSNQSALPTFNYTTNLAFLHVYPKMLQLAQNISNFTQPQNLLSQMTGNATFQVDLNKTGIPEKLTDLQRWVSMQKKIQSKRKVVKMNDTALSDTAEDYFNKITYMTVTQGRWTASILFITVIGLVGYVIWLSVQVKKLKTLVATLALQGLPLCKAHDPNLPKVVCHETWFSVLCTCITLIGILIWMFKLLKTKYIFKGYKFSRLSELYLIVCDSSRYVPIRVKTIKGHIHRVKLELDPDFNDTQVILSKNFLWDTLTVNWGNTSLTYYGDKISLPRSLVVPLLDKIRLRRLMTLPFDAFLMVKQGKEWKRLDSAIYVQHTDQNM